MRPTTIRPSGISSADSAGSSVHAGASAPDAQVQAYGRIYQSLQVQSQTLAYIDTFMVLAVLASIMFVLAFIVRKNDPGGGGHVVAE